MHVILRGAARYAVVLGCLLPLLLHAQPRPGSSDREVLAYLLAARPVDTAAHVEHTPFTFREPNELTLLLTGLIRAYQLGISSQYLPVCNFSLSCSRFGMAAIRRYGVLEGGLMTFDRLQRCNGLGRGYYPHDPETHKARDRIADYHLRLP
jgi:putative component of membrane protein insertase Oxa1/YidC/SpoIIIJ protein YidD